MAAEFRLTIDRSTAQGNIPELFFFSRQIEDCRHTAQAVLRPAVVPMDIVPSDAEVVATNQRSTGADLVAEGPDYLVLIHTYADETYIAVAARSVEKATEMIEQLKRHSTEESDRADVKIALWSSKSGEGGERRKRTVRSRTWSEIEANYPSPVRCQLQRLAQRTQVSDGEGRLILFHGEPGTGKTTAIRALMREWSSWCETHLVADPDRLFADSDYLLDILHSQEGPLAPTLSSAAPQANWKLIVAEDTDVYLKRSPRTEASGALGRLLNTTDGLLGHSSRALVLLSTNEGLVHLHPALTRPGRCLAQTEFMRFSREEATSWLGRPMPSTGGGATLAELYEARRTGGPLPGQAVLTGRYL